MISNKREQSRSYMILVGLHIFTSADVSMIDFGCIVSQYHQFYDKYL